MTKWLDVSEIVAGKIFDGEISPHELDPMNLMSPYREVVYQLREGRSLTDIMAEDSMAAVLSAQRAAKEVDSAPIDWLSLLQRTRVQYEAGTVLMQEGRKMERGEGGDVAIVMQALEQAYRGKHHLVPLSEVEVEETIWKKTGWDPIDKHVGGIPSVGMTIIGGAPGVGKTGLMCKLAARMMKKHKKEIALLYSLEMTNAQLLLRLTQIEEDSQEVRKRIWASEHSMSIGEIYAEASMVCAHEKVGLIGIDFADMLVQGETTAGAMGLIYKQVAELAKNNKVPVLLLSQLNRQQYVGGIPKVNHLYWSGMAEATAVMIYLIHNPGQIFVERAKQDWLVPRAGHGYLILGKSRFGSPRGLGAVQVPFDGRAAWGDKTSPESWYPLKEQ